MNLSNKTGLIERWQQEDHEFKASWSYIVRPHLKETKRKTTLFRTLEKLL
jgi:hypothetical protein